MLALVFFVGLSLLLYPFVSDAWNSFHQARAIATYADQVDRLGTVDYQALWTAAESYNQALTGKANRFAMTEEERADYNGLLNVGGTGVMGYVVIPRIGTKMPIYHGTEETVLQIGAGHLEGSSLPTGGAGTHCVLSGHRGLPTARLFTDIAQLQKGDVFVLHVLDRTMTYQVDQILTVEPSNVEALAIDPAQDYCTLVTCTPYGINSHRLLVRGHRVSNQSVEDSDSLQVGPVAVVCALGAATFVVGIVLRAWARRRL